MSNTQTDTYIDTETGLVLRRDPFGGNEVEILGLGDPSQWEIVEEDFGPIVEWQETPVLAGVLINQKVVDIDHDDNRGTVATNIYCFEDLMTKERRAVYGNFQIDQALGCEPAIKGQKSEYIGRTMLLKWEGKREQGKGGRTLNTYTIAIKREPVREEEPS